ncbi:hypothetical protein [Bifidobacterium crudilactis]|uniref:hypothetical protein n=1 Tax=Bifidobacterium crudilactis TaxID=327277 RepID=UPI002352718D|nr:hypothetical protein [Bifidobacterium crudilactis]MCI1867871.1 hypothetical protein [Bifidobacterium crudilactis]
MNIYDDFSPRAMSSAPYTRCTFETRRAPVDELDMDWFLFLIFPRSGDDGIMAKKYDSEFRERAVRLLADSRANYWSETKALQGVAKDLGTRQSGCVGGRNVPMLQILWMILVNPRG